MASMMTITALDPLRGSALRGRLYASSCLQTSAADLADAIDTAAAAAQAATLAESAGSADLGALTAALDDAAAQVRVEAEQLLKLVGWLGVDAGAA